MTILEKLEKLDFYSVSTHSDWIGKELLDKEVIKQFITEELKALKSECVGEEKDIDQYGNSHTEEREMLLDQGYNEKRKEVEEIFNKRVI